HTRFSRDWSSDVCSSDLVWQPIIAEAKAIDPECKFFAETLGCTPEQALALRPAGFDFLFNSAKWWDFRSPWLLEQYELYRQIARSEERRVGKEWKGGERR